MSVDGKYRFSLNISQVVDLGIKVGSDYTEVDINGFEQASQFGKIYGRTLEYCLIRPRSIREVRDYLYRKTRPTRLQDGTLSAGIPSEMTNLVIDKLIEKNYLDDYKFAVFWVNNRFTRKGVSRRRLVAELNRKGVERAVIDKVFDETDRNDTSEISKIIVKKRMKYDDKQLMAYLARQGFSYDDIKQALSED